MPPPPHRVMPNAMSESPAPGTAAHGTTQAIGQAPVQRETRTTPPFSLFVGLQNSSPLALHQPLPQRPAESGLQAARQVTAGALALERKKFGYWLSYCSNVWGKLLGMSPGLATEDQRRPSACLFHQLQAPES